MCHRLLTLWDPELAESTLAKEGALKRRYPMATGAPHFVISCSDLRGLCACRFVDGQIAHLKLLHLPDEPERQLTGAQPASVFVKVFRDLAVRFARQQQQQRPATAAATAGKCANLCTQKVS